MNHLSAFLSKVHGVTWGLLCTLLLFPAMSVAQEQAAKRIPPVPDQLREQYTPQDFKDFQKKEKAGEILPQGGPVFSPAGADVLVNNNTGATGAAYFTQSETTILAFGSDVLVGFNDAGSNAGVTNKFTGFSYSTDGGSTFTDGGTLPTNAGGDAGDPVMARHATSGTIYFATLGFNITSIQVFRSTDNGHSWMMPVNGTPGGFKEDKAWLAVDNFSGTGNGNVYLMSRSFGPANGIFMYRSTDGGATFGPTGGTLIVSGQQGAFVDVGPDHSVYAFWWTPTSLQMRKSTDLGLTFGAAVTVVGGLTPPPGVNGDLGLIGIRQGTAPAPFRSNSFPHVAVNPVSGHLYVTFNDNPPGIDKADVFMVMSIDGGATWSARVRVNDDATITDQWQPTIAVTPDGGSIGIFYYSRQEDPALNNSFKYYGRTGIISGSTVAFLPSFAISDVASLPEFGRDAVVNPVYMGDYNFAVGTSGTFHVVWSDNRDDLSGGGARKDPNVYYEAVPAPALLSGPNINVSPSNVDFGAVPQSSTAGPRTITMMNIGDADLTVSAITNPSPDFSSSLPALPVTIPSLGSASLTVSFSPLSGGAQTSSFTITSNALNDAVVAVNLQGTGIAPPPNDLCADAISISCGSSIEGTTVLATFDDAGTCGITNTAPGVWYSIAGTGGPMSVSTCAAASYDTKVSVFSGSCGALTCVGGNDDFSGCGLRSQVSWSSVLGTTYYVLVHGFGSAVGTFTLTTSGCPAQISVAPSALTIFTALNGAGSAQMDISNTAGAGAVDLNWSIHSTQATGPAGQPQPSVAARSAGHENREPMFRITDHTMSALRSGRVSAEALAKLATLVNGPATTKEAFLQSASSLIGELQLSSCYQALFENSMIWVERQAEKEKVSEEEAVTLALGGTPHGGGILAAGGPDAFGYEFIDSDEPGGPVFSWTDITGTGTAVILGDDASIQVPLPFTFPFYGVGKSDVRISSNGYLTFGTSGTTFTNTDIPNAANPNDIICPFWDDLNPSTGGTIHYSSSATQFIVQYTGVPRFSTTQPNTFEVILNADGSMLFQYLDMQGLLTSATVGIENAAGTVGLQVVLNDAYVHNNLAVRVALPPSCPWISSVSPPLGTIAAGSSQQVTIGVNAAGQTIGTHLCDVAVRSNAGNASVVTVPVTLIVGTPTERIDDLIAKVQALQTGGVLSKGQANSLISKLQAAQKKLAQGNRTSAVAQLMAFINAVMDLVANNILTPAQGQVLIDAANATIDLINAGLAPGGKFVLSTEIPTQFALDQNYPNPFNPTTTIQYALPQGARVTLEVFDLLGRRVVELVNGQVAAGYYEVEFNATSLASGIYFYRMMAEGVDGQPFVQIRRLMVLK